MGKKRIEFSKALSQSQRIKMLKEKAKLAKFAIRAVDPSSKRVALQTSQKLLILSEFACDCGGINCFHLMWFKENDVWDRLRSPCPNCQFQIEDKSYKTCECCRKIFHVECLIDKWKQTCSHCKSGKMSSLEEFLTIEKLPQSLQEAEVKREQVEVRKKSSLQCWSCGREGVTTKSCSLCSVLSQ